MLNYPLFHQTAAQLRSAGARGGKATARNRRLRQAGISPAPSAEAAPSIGPRETTASAIAALDAQFPWLRGVGRRLRPE
jgi:hypothetical protein